MGTVALYRMCVWQCKQCVAVCYKQCVAVCWMCILYCSTVQDVSGCVQDLLLYCSTVQDVSHPVLVQCYSTGCVQEHILCSARLV